MQVSVGGLQNVALTNAQDIGQLQTDMTQAQVDINGNTNLVGNRMLLADGIQNTTDIGTNATDIAANTAAISGLQASAPASHYHTFQDQTGQTPGGNPQYAQGVTSGPAGSTATVHSHAPADIPHTHDMGNHTHYTTTTQYQVTHSLPSQSQPSSTNSTSGAQ